MKSICVMDSVSRINGGIFEAERKLQQHLQAGMRIEVGVIGLQDAYTEADREAWSPLAPVTLPVSGPHAFGYASGFTRALIDSEADLAYSVGLWKAPSLSVLQWSNQTGKPFIVAPHGMLDLWAVRNSGLKKRVAGWFFQNSQLRKAACLRALCESEAESIHAYGLTNPVCVIPNGVDLPNRSTGQEQRPAFFPTDKKVLLYLGRLHPKKGLVNLLTAWKSARPFGRDWILVIAGWDQVGHEAELKRKASELGVADSILFPGPRFGGDKEACYRSCDIFILPSVSEGLPMVVLEAWAYAKPVIMTPACNLPEGFAARAAMRVEPTLTGLIEGLRIAFELSSEEMRAMGERGRVLAENIFTWPKVSEQMASVYKWVLGQGAKPDCVDGR
jgi:glycosyltransferase involved in cell wall biosynthesis